MMIGICDDEKEIRDQIARKVMNYYPEAEVYDFSSGHELLNTNKSIDILFLDIHLQDSNGIEVAQEVRMRDQNMIIIFVTAFEQYVFKAFDVQAFHYLVKPFDNRHFQQILQAAIENRRVQNMKEVPFLIIKKGYEVYKIFHHQILYAEVLGRKITLYTPKGEYTYNGKFGELEQQLGEDFYRVHRSFIIHLKFIAHYDTTIVTLDKGISITIAQKKYTAFVQHYLQYLKRKGYQN